MVSTPRVVLAKQTTYVCPLEALPTGTSNHPEFPDIQKVWSSWERTHGSFAMRIAVLLWCALCSLVFFGAPPSTSGQGPDSPLASDPNRSAKDGSPRRKQLYLLDGSDPDSTKGVPTSFAIRPVRKPQRPDFNRDIYYKNKLERSVETGWLPINVPFVFDFLVGSRYNEWPLHYTLVPNIASIRWQLDNIWGWKMFRGNTDFSFSGSYTAIPRGAETRYFAFDYGIRRNFIPPHSRVVPYVEGRGGIGNINAKGPRGVYYSQGQDMTFTLMVGSGARYNFSPRYGVSAGVTYMHVSNFYLSEPRYEDFGINVYGPMVGVYIRLGKEKESVLR